MSKSNRKYWKQKCLLDVNDEDGYFLSIRNYLQNVYPSKYQNDYKSQKNKGVLEIDLCQLGLKLKQNWKLEYCVVD